MTFEEGKIQKGGRNSHPKTSRPDPPKGQGAEQEPYERGKADGAKEEREACAKAVRVGCRAGCTRVDQVHSREGSVFECTSWRIHARSL